MNRRFNTILLLALVSTCSLAAPCQAGPFFDWLFKRNRQPVTAYNAGAAGCCGQGYCEQTVVRYVPQTSYRTVWQPVPVTSYRRTTHCNPQTGLPVTCTRPCTTYTYQARRVPYTSYRPVYTRVPVTDTFAASPVSAASPIGCNSCSTGFASTSPSYTTTNPSPNGYATPWRDYNGTNGAGSSRRSADSYSDSGADYGDNVPRIQRDRNDEFDQGAMPRRLSRMPSTRYRVNRQQNYRSGASSERFASDARRARRPDSILADSSRSGFNRDSSSRSSVNRDRASRDRFLSDRNDLIADGIVRHQTLNRQALKPLNEESVGREKVRSDIKPFQNLDAPLNDRLPAMFDFPEENKDREARRRVRRIPTRWAANVIAWNRVVQANHETRDKNVRTVDHRRPIAKLHSDRETNANRDGSGRTSRANRVRFSSEQDAWQSDRKRRSGKSSEWQSF